MKRYSLLEKPLKYIEVKLFHPEKDKLNLYMALREDSPRTTHVEIGLNQYFPLFKDLPIVLAIPGMPLGHPPIGGKFSIYPNRVASPIRKAFTPFDHALTTSVRSEGVVVSELLAPLSEGDASVENAPDKLWVECILLPGKEQFRELKKTGLPDWLAEIHIQIEVVPMIDAQDRRNKIVGGRFESSAEVLNENYFHLAFNAFYPVRRGPIRGEEKHGLPIFLPDDEDKISTVQARFVRHPMLIPR